MIRTQSEVYRADGFAELAGMVNYEFGKFSKTMIKVMYNVQMCYLCLFYLLLLPKCAIIFNYAGMNVKEWVTEWKGYQSTY